MTALTTAYSRLSTLKTILTGAAPREEDLVGERAIFAGADRSSPSGGCQKFQPNFGPNPGRDKWRASSQATPEAALRVLHCVTSKQRVGVRIPPGAPRQNHFLQSVPRLSVHQYSSHFLTTLPQLRNQALDNPCHLIQRAITRVILRERISARLSGPQSVDSILDVRQSPGISLLVLTVPMGPR